MKHLKTIKNFIESSTFPLLSEELQNMLLQTQHEFVINKIEDVLHDSLLPYLLELEDDLSFNVKISKNGEIEVSSLMHENEVTVQNKQPKFLESITDSNDNDTIDTDTPLDVYVTDVLTIDRDLLTRGIIVISSRYYPEIERIMHKDVVDLDDVPIDILFNGKLYEDASLCCIDIGDDSFGQPRCYLQLRWGRQSRLAKDMRLLLSSQNQKHVQYNDSIGSSFDSYSFFSVSYNYVNAAFQINVFRDNPSNI